MNITKFETQETMTLKEITDLLEVRHDNAMIMMNKLVNDQEFGTAPKIEESYTSGNGTKRYVATYQLNKRQSIAVASRLNTALLMRIIDRWQELENAAKENAFTLPDFTNPSIAARAWAEQFEQKEALSIENKKLQDTLDLIENVQGSLLLTDSAKILGIKPRLLTEWMKNEKWIYKRNGNNASWVGFQDKLDSNLLDHKITRFFDGLMEHVSTQVRVTPEGLVKLANVFTTQLSLAIKKSS